MPDIPQLVAAIDARLVEISAEMSALGAAKAELVAPRAARPAPGVAVDAIANPSPPRAARRGVTPPRRQVQRSLRRRVSERVEATRDAGGDATPRRSTRQPTTTAARPPSGGGAVPGESLERLLADTPAGLSANAVAQRAGAGYARTLKRLHEREAAGTSQRSTLSCTSVTSGGLRAGSFRSRRRRFGRPSRSCEVAPMRRCHFRTTAQNCPTASRQRDRGLGVTQIVKALVSRLL